MKIAVANAAISRYLIVTPAICAEPKFPNDGNGSPTVSYTHLRAHETGAYLVCRLLLEKKNTADRRRVLRSVVERETA